MEVASAMHFIAATFYSCAVACFGIIVGGFAVLLITSESPLIFAGTAIGGIVGVIAGSEMFKADFPVRRMNGS
jgi:hypothetical protein